AAGRGETRRMAAGRGETRGIARGRDYEMGLGSEGGGRGRGMMPTRGAQTGARGNPARRTAFDAEKLLQNEQIKIWAHDEGVQPGSVYRYRMKVGVFNPLAGTDRFTPEQKNLQNDVILWSAPVVVQKMVRIPERVVFFPKSGSADQAVASFEVFRRHQGRWYKRAFSVTPGSVLGQFSVPTSKKHPSATPIQIDFCTNATILDIIPNSAHWYRSGSALSSVSATDIIIQLADGTVTRMVVDKRCWTQQQKSQHSGITKQIREDENSPG
ncbi:MAG: hypothetical protein KAR11_02850, partial [Phycisphaerae bacterium]|nr:hypothetical protein [Phycisphaerae bacterium]